MTLVFSGATSCWSCKGLSSFSGGGGAARQCTRGQVSRCQPLTVRFGAETCVRARVCVSVRGGRERRRAPGHATGPAEGLSVAIDQPRSLCAYLEPVQNAGGSSVSSSAPVPVGARAPDSCPQSFIFLFCSSGPSQIEDGERHFGGSESPFHRKASLW